MSRKKKRLERGEHANHEARFQICLSFSRSKVHEDSKKDIYHRSGEKITILMNLMSQSMEYRALSIAAHRKRWPRASDS